MARRRAAEKRKVVPDYKYKQIDVSRFINKEMVNGKKSIAQKIVYQALDIVEKDAKKSGLEIFRQAMNNAMPVLEVKSRRVGGATYQVPTEVIPARRTTLAIRWIVDAARSRSGISMAQSLSRELLEASKGQGAAVKRREDLYKMAEANRAFVHFRW